MATKQNKKEKDLRYKTVKVLIEERDIKTFREIFDYIPRSVVYSDLGINYTRFINLVKHTEDFTLKELIMMSKHIGTDPKPVIDMAYDQYLIDNKAKIKGGGQG